jgi:hypothetical protein
MARRAEPLIHHSAKAREERQQRLRINGRHGELRESPHRKTHTSAANNRPNKQGINQIYNNNQQITKYDFLPFNIGLLMKILFS